MRNRQCELEVLVNQARDELGKIGKLLIDDGCIEIWNLVNEIGEIRSSAPIEEYGIAFAGFCSQSGRLAGVMSTLGKIGSKACEASGGGGGASDSKTPYTAQPRHLTAEFSKREEQLRCQLQEVVQEFGRLGAELQWLCEKDVQFIVCDAHVLHDHPELVQAEVIRKRFAVATGHLETLSEGWWNLAEETKKMADAYEAALAAHSSPHKIN